MCLASRLPLTMKVVRCIFCALLFCGETPRGRIECIEYIDEYRFLENDKKMKMVEIPAETLSVDTKTDLIVVRNVIQRRINDGEIVL